jgi:hypothetical protein
MSNTAKFLVVCALATVFICWLFGVLDFDEAKATLNQPQLEHNAAHMQKCMAEAVRIYEAELQVKKNIYSGESITAIALKLYDDSPNERR